MLSLHWFRYWDKVFWVLFILLGLSVVIGGMTSMVSFELALLIGVFIIIMGAGKLGNEISGQKLVNYQDDMYRKLHQFSQHLETTFNLADSYKTKTEFRLGKMDTRRKETEYKVEENYRDVARKVLELDNKLNRMTKIMVERESVKIGQKEATFTEKVLSLVRRVPRGKVTTYSEIAKTIGKPSASKATGRIISTNSHLKSLPLHRVVKSNGKIVGSSSAAKKRATVLRKEGVKVEKGMVNLDRHMFSFVPEI